MYKDEIDNIIKTITEAKEIEYSEIPNISLYMEQVLTFLNEELVTYKLKEDDKLYTKSMINNYVKCNLLTKPVNKKYSPAHVVELILIFYLKQILTIEDIKNLFDITLDKNNIKDVYNNYLKYTKESLSDFDKEIEYYTSVLGNDSSINENDSIFLLISILNAKASAYKLFSQRLINKINTNENIINKQKNKKSKDIQQKKEVEKSKKQEEKNNKNKEINTK